MDELFGQLYGRYGCGPDGSNELRKAVGDKHQVSVAVHCVDRFTKYVYEN